MVTMTHERMEVQAAVVLILILSLMVAAFLVTRSLLSFIPGYSVPVYQDTASAVVGGHTSMMSKKQEAFYKQVVSERESERIGRVLINSEYLSQ